MVGREGGCGEVGGGDKEFGAAGGEGGDYGAVGWAGGGGAHNRERGARDSPFSGWKGVLPREQRYERGVYAADYEQGRAVDWVAGLGVGVQER